MPNQFNKKDAITHVLIIHFRKGYIITGFSSISVGIRVDLDLEFWYHPKNLIATEYLVKYDIVI